MKAKTIKALDAVIAGLEELKEALESEASKSGSGADDAGPGKVSGSKKPAKSAGVPAKGKGSRPAPDDDDDVDDGDEPDDTDDDDEVPTPKAAVKGKAAAVKGKAAAATKGKSKAKAEATLEDVKTALTNVMNEGSLGKAAVLKILKKYGAAKSSDLEEDDFAAVIKACEAQLAAVETDEDDEDDED